MTSYWARWRLKTPVSQLFTQPFIQAQIKEKHQNSASLAFVRGIHRWPVNSPHKWSVTRKMFPFGDATMKYCFPVQYPPCRIRFTYVSSWDYVWLQQDVPVLWMMRLDVPDVGNGVYVKGELLMPDDRVREVSANNASTMSKIISLRYLSVIIICGSLLTSDVHNGQEKKVIVVFFHKQWLAKQAFILMHGQVITSI